MLISKKQGKKLSVKHLNSVYGGLDCGGKCGDCDCTSPRVAFYGAFDNEMTEYNSTLIGPPPE